MYRKGVDNALYWGVVRAQGRLKAPPGNAKCVTEILGGGEQKQKLGDKIYLFCLKGNSGPSSVFNS